MADIADSNMTGRRGLTHRFPPLAFAYLGVFAALILFVVTLSMTGSARDGDPVVALAVAPFTDTTSTVNVPVLPQETRRIGGHLVADPALLEQTPLGILPKIAADGRTPRDAYAGAAIAATDTRPRIALVMRDLGIGDGATSVALSNLPAGVTLAFIPYVDNLQNWIDKARSGGHEVLMELPMEPLDFPDSDPGPRALLVGANAQENNKRLAWALSRATGYAGLANLMGTRFMGEAPALDPIFAELSKRGLMFFDDGSSARSQALAASKQSGLPLATSALTVDAVQTTGAIDEQLAQLEQRAHESGSAVGTASPFPVTIERVAAWAQSVEARGFVLVPVSAVMKKAAPVPQPQTPAATPPKP